ncbi:MAG: hypothetical protein WA705_27800 [Candidatus Ozemobacteraceae bacterium]
MTSIFSLFRRSKKGSILLLASGMLFCIVLYSVAYSNYMLMQKRLSEKAGKHGVMAKVAFALATLGIHKIQYGPMLANVNWPYPRKAVESPCLYKLFEQLAKPRGAMDPEVTGTIDFHEIPTSELLVVVNKLTAPLEKMGAFDGTVFYHCRRDDFQEMGLCANGYRREKKGFLRLTVETRLTKSGLPPIVEEFHYKCPVKVTMAIAPVLSKFSMYLENGNIPGGSDFYGFNQVMVDEVGEVYANSPAKPLVFDNDGFGESVPHGPLHVEKTFKDLVEPPRGLIYIGGPGNILLNLAYSKPTVSSSGSGEGFQLFRRANGDGLYKLPALSGITPARDLVDIYEMIVGVSPSPDEDVQSFYDLIKKYCPKFWIAFRDTWRIEASSIFRLYGVDKNHSPTLVLGNVQSEFLRARVFHHPPLANSPWGSPGRPPLYKGAPFGKLFLFEDPNEYLAECQTANGVLLPLIQANLLSNSNQVGYLMDYASFIATRSYNIGMSYVLNQTISEPWKTFPDSDKLYSFFWDGIPPELLHGIPEPFNTIFPGTNDLKQIDAFLAVFAGADKSRLAYEIEIPAGSPPNFFYGALQDRGLLTGDRLTLSGWIKVKSPEKKLILDRDLKVMGNGGIVLEEGDITVKNAIAPDSPAKATVILQLITLKGNIILQTAPQTVLQTGLVANGKIIFAGSPRIIGSIAAKRLYDQPDELKNFSGGNLQYYPPLGAFPLKPNEALPLNAQTDEPLLSFNFNLLPIIMD